MNLLLHSDNVLTNICCCRCSILCLSWRHLGFVLTFNTLLLPFAFYSLSFPHSVIYFSAFGRVSMSLCVIIKNSSDIWQNGFWSRSGQFLAHVANCGKPDYFVHLCNWFSASGLKESFVVLVALLHQAEWEKATGMVLRGAMALW